MLGQASLRAVLLQWLVIQGYADEKTLNFFNGITMNEFLGEKTVYRARIHHVAAA